MKKETKFILAIVIQMVIILLIILFKVVILTRGTEILLKIGPVDPRDPLRGDYMSFQYEISRLDASLLSDYQVKNDDTVYVVLRKIGKYWTATSVLKTKPIGGAGQEVFLKGRVVSGGLSREKDFFPGRDSSILSITVTYGIEEYYIPEGSGANLNLWRQGAEAYAKVVVDEDGRAVLKQIYLNDQPWP